MDDSKSRHEERALQAHLAHYDALRRDILQESMTQTQLVNYAIAIIGGVVTLTALGQGAILNQFTFIYLVASLLMSGVTWASLELEVRIHDQAQYINDVLSPKVQKLVGGDDDIEHAVLKWELANTIGKNFVRSALRATLVIGKFTVSYFPAIFFAATFLFIKSVNGSTWQTFENLLFGLAALMIVVILIGSGANLLFVIRYYRSPSKNVSQGKTAKRK